MPKGIYKRKKQNPETTEKIRLANLGRKNTEEYKLRMRMVKRWNTKGDDAGYTAMHDWVKRWKGAPKLCENCGTTTAKKFEWANRDHLYKRVLEDYTRMCTSCHRRYDYDNHLSNKGSGYGSIKNKI